MNKTERQHNWSVFLKLFSLQNQMRSTRLGVFEGEPGAMTDYWIEDGLPLNSVEIDLRGAEAPIIEIMLGNIEKPDTQHLTHRIKQARFMKIVLSLSGESDGLDIEDEEGRTTVLRFEK